MGLEGRLAMDIRLDIGGHVCIMAVSLLCRLGSVLLLIRAWRLLDKACLGKTRN